VFRAFRIESRRMTARNSPTNFGSVARTLHWGMALLILVSLAMIELRGWAPRGSVLRGSLRDWHSQAGLVVFSLVWFRLAWRLANLEPEIVPPPAAWQRRVAHAVEWSFYALMVVLPVLGIVMMQADGKTVSLLGASLPPMVAVDKAWSHRLEDIHGWCGNAMMFLIAAHVSASLLHRFIHRDNTLSRMW
jgi:cytochrome b561